jgi:hypothetical protein
MKLGIRELVLKKESISFCNEVHVLVVFFELDNLIVEVELFSVT